MFNSFDQKNVIVVTSGIGALCLVGSLWYYKTSVWNNTKRLFGYGSDPNGSGPNGSGPNGSGPNGSGPNGSGPNGSGEKK
jgi:hypothetical protein